VTAALDQGWVERLVAGTTGVPARPGLDATVALTAGTAGRVVFEVRDGRVVGPSPGPADIEIPVTEEQLAGLEAGEVSLATAYMRGDIKPVGPSGALLVAVEVLEDPRTWSRFRR
jgi:hypothetical protein